MAKWQARKGDVSPRKGTGIAPQIDEWENDEEIGTCDTCGGEYELASREGRCGECGECAEHCKHGCIHAVVYEKPNWENLVCMSCGAEVENTEY